MTDESAHNACSLEPPRRRWWRDLILGVLLFSCGCLLGSIVTGRVIVSRAAEAQRAGMDLQTALARLNRALDLNEEQRREVTSIIGQGLKDLREIREELRPQVETVLKKIKEEVSAVLDERQKAVWEHRFEMVRKRWFATLQGKGGLGRGQN